MGHFARVDGNDIVRQVIVAEQDFIDTLADKDSWVQTSYNKRIRKNYASIGFKYDRQRDAFIPPQPEIPGWTLNEETCTWVPDPSLPLLKSDLSKAEFRDLVARVISLAFYKELRTNDAMFLANDDFNWWATVPAIQMPIYFGHAMDAGLMTADQVNAIMAEWPGGGVVA